MSNILEKPRGTERSNKKTPISEEKEYSKGVEREEKQSNESQI
jgi:hypothetical protein